MIQTIINEPLILTSNTSPLVYDETNVRTRCAFCCNGGWLDYQEGTPLFKVFGNGYTGYYEVNWSGTLSTGSAGVVAIGLYEDGILIPDSVRAVTLTADGYASVSLNEKIRVCPRGTTTLTIASVPSVPSTDPTTPVVTQIPTVISGTFSIKRI